jgi:hypothetical protein
VARHPARGRRQSTTAAGAGETAGWAVKVIACRVLQSGPGMLGRDWALLVTGTLLGVVSLTADLLGIGAFAGFGWKQAIGTAAALVLVIPSGWRIFHASRRERP